MSESIFQEQIDYYQARAGEYDEWFLREGRYDRGEEHRQKWFSEVRKVEEALEASQPKGDVLELACGTGLWTQHLVCWANSITAIDAVAETMEINKQRVNDARVSYVQADLFEWKPERSYDYVFFGFWISHVPKEKFQSFWSMVRSALKPNGQVFFLDGLFQPESTAKDHKPIDHSGVVERKVNDGRSFRIVKVFHEPQELGKQLVEMGWEGYVRDTGEFFYYGCVKPD